MDKNVDVRYEVNNEKNGIELYFSGKPSESIREELKENGWRWHTAKKCWFNKASDDNKSFAQKLCVKTIPVDNSAKKVEKDSQPVRVKTTTKYVDRKSITNIWTVDREKGKKLELGVSLEKEGEYDLRVWKDDKGYSDDGVKISYDELIMMAEALKNFEASYKKKKDHHPYGRGEIVFQNDIFRTTYLGVEYEDGDYRFWFETENLSEYLIRVVIERLFICDCEVLTWGGIIAVRLQPHKKVVDYVEVSKSDLSKHWIKKIWEYTVIEADLGMAYHRDVRDTQFWDDEPDFVAKISLKPDKYRKSKT